MSGPALFSFAACAVTVAYLLAVTLRRLSSRARLAAWLARERLEAYELAYLTGQAERVVTTALTTMVADGRLRLSPSGAIEVALPEAAHPIEEAVLETLGWSVTNPRSSEVLIDVPRRPRQVFVEVVRSRQVSELHERLALRGALLSDDGARSEGRRGARRLGVINLAAAGLAAVLAVLAQWPVWVALVPAVLGFAVLVGGNSAPRFLAREATSGEVIDAAVERLCAESVDGRAGEAQLRRVAAYGIEQIPNEQLREALESALAASQRTRRRSDRAPGREGAPAAS